MGSKLRLKGDNWTSCFYLFTFSSSVDYVCSIRISPLQFWPDPIILLLTTSKDICGRLKMTVILATPLLTRWSLILFFPFIESFLLLTWPMECDINNVLGLLSLTFIFLRTCHTDTLCMYLFIVHSQDYIINFMKTRALPDCSWLYSQGRKQSLPHSGHSINICWMNEFNGTYKIGLLTPYWWQSSTLKMFPFPGRT